MAEKHAKKIATMFLLVK